MMVVRGIEPLSDGAPVEGQQHDDARAGALDAGGGTPEPRVPPADRRRRRLAASGLGLAAPPQGRAQ